MCNNKNELEDNLFASYFEFLNQYSPIEDDTDYKENRFILELLETLSDIFNKQERKSIAEKIFMIYPSFFAPTKEDLKPIGNDNTMMLSSASNRDLQQRIALHLSYYQQNFLRFSGSCAIVRV